MAKEVPYRLLAKYFSGNCTEEEKLRVEQWKDANAENEGVFQQYRDAWERSKTDKSLFTPDVDKALKNVNQQLSMEETSRSAKVVNMAYYVKRIAAVLVIAAGLWMAYQWIRQRSVKETLVEVATLQGEKKMVVLPDSSHVWLNSHTKLKYGATFAGKKRKVYLEGEAYFEVTKNPSRPFVIEAGNSVTTVLGTAFNVRARKSETTVVVTVSEGKVAFTGKKMKTDVKLLPGDKGILDYEKKQVEQVKNQDPNFLAWKTRRLVFKNTPLSQVVSKLTECYGRSVMVEDASKADIPFTSTFDHQSLRDAITIIEMSLGVKADTVTNVIVLK